MAAAAEAVCDLTSTPTTSAGSPGARGASGSVIELLTSSDDEEIEVPLDRGAMTRSTRRRLY
jgi:hypothetical protein